MRSEWTITGKRLKKNEPPKAPFQVGDIIEEVNFIAGAKYKVTDVDVNLQKLTIEGMDSWLSWKIFRLARSQDAA